MGSPLGPVLANIFMCKFEEKWILNNNAHPSIWFRYVDDTITLFDSKTQQQQQQQQFIGIPIYRWYNLKKNENVKNYCNNKY